MDKPLKWQQFDPAKHINSYWIDTEFYNVENHGVRERGAMAKIHMNLEERPTKQK